MPCPKLILNCGNNGPDGTNNCSKSNKDNKSSGNPEGKRSVGSSKENGRPKPGMVGPLGPLGILIDTSLGEHGLIVFLIYQVNIINLIELTQSDR